MSIEFRCPGCSKTLRVPDESIGKQARCPNCGQIHYVPTTMDASAGLETSAAPQIPAAMGAPPPAKPAPQASPFPDFSERPAVGPVPVNPYQSPQGDGFGRRQIARQELASRGTRLLGALLDGFIMLAAATPFAILGWFVAKAMDSRDGDMMVMIIVLCGMPGFLIIAIINWVMISQRGQSIGKRILGMRIVKSDGQLPGFVNGVILRIWVPAVINQMCNLFGLIDALWIFGEERRCLHDLIASTHVVDVSKEAVDPLNDDYGESPFA